MVDRVTRGKAPASPLTRSLDSGGKVTASRPAYPRSGYETVGNWVHGRWVVGKGKV
ncbi:hypothetical protein [Streptomyces sp. NPDC057616]|uniref:hypothetical protein n=1 Tax=Streptomyces sp. NPDC057616 TaxID=3346183 RepID=UPI00367F06C5